jgi:hypothetical protein
MAQTIELQTRLASRTQLETRARMLAHLGNGWHFIEFGIALGAGIAARSVALTSFAGVSLVEVLAASVIVWLFSAGHGGSAQAERRAQRLIAASYLLLVTYILSQAPFQSRGRARIRRQAGSESGSPPLPRRRWNYSHAPSARSDTRSTPPRP